MDEHELRRAARDKLERGELPRLSPERIWINDGDGETCALCGRPIDASETEYELQFALRGDLAAGDLVAFQFHTSCHAAWQVERVRS